ncbi:MAG: hypothetical protein RIF37_00540 [Rhodospirillaceae bacterium]
MNSHRDARGRFTHGHNYSQGKSRGARNQLQADLLQALADDFAEHGPETIARTRRKAPAQYLKICVAALPTDMTLTINPLQELTDEDLHARMRDLEQLYQNAFRGQAGVAGRTVAPCEDDTAETLPALPAPKSIS